MAQTPNIQRDTVGGASDVRPAASTVARESSRGQQAVAQQQALVREIVTTLLITIILFIGLRYSAQAVPLDGPSMQPGLHTDERVLVNSLAYLFQEPSRGDVIVFYPPNNPSERYIKRVIGIPGDTVQLTLTNVYINGRLLDEPYVAKTPLGYSNNLEPEIIKLNPEQFFVMGDNRTDSQDSRFFGPISRRAIIGQAEFVVWPLGNVESIDTYPQTFAPLKGS